MVILLSLLVYFLLPNFSEPQRRVAAVIVFAIFFWGFEIIPLYATSLLIVLLLTFLLTSPVDILKADTAAVLIFLAPFSSPIMMLFLGGLAMAAAMHKQQLNVFLIDTMLSKLGNQPYVLLAGILSISAFFSMWISNTAAAALVLTLIMPVMNPLYAEDPFKK